MKITIKHLIFAIPFLMVSILLNAQNDFPRTASGKPDFNGNYDISSLTPFQRPTEYGDRLYLSEDEVQTLRDREMGIRARGSDPSDPDRAAPEALSLIHI